MALLELKGVRKAFPGVLALDGVDFTLEPGEIRALMGENGAGKSTLIKVLTGVYQADSGELVLAGVRIRPRSPAHAQELGISTVYQEVNLVPNLSVAENICLGSESRKGNRNGPIDWKAIRKRGQEALLQLSLRIDVNQPLGSFSTAIQQLVAIARALDREAKVLVLDEPTSSLDAAETARLFGLLKELRDRGIAIIFVTHFLSQVYDLCSSITVLRNGQLIGTWPTVELPPHDLVVHMLGKSIGEAAGPALGEMAATTVLKATGIGKRGKVKPLDLEVGSGEVVGLSGLLGSGRTETMRLVFAVDSLDSGKVEIDGTRRRVRSPADAVRAGLGMCPEDRKAEGICPGLSIRENIVLVAQAKRGWFRPLSRAKQNLLVEEMIAALRIKTSDGGGLIENLSGGNQQKALLARWLIAHPRLLLLDEPTRGVDIGSKAEILGQVRKLASEGMAFLFTSSELEEVVQVAGRVIVLRDQEKVGELTGGAISEGALMELIAGGAAS